jgi:hypothetical protein
VTIASRPLWKERDGVSIIQKFDLVKLNSENPKLIGDLRPDRKTPQNQSIERGVIQIDPLAGGSDFFAASDLR